MNRIRIILFMCNWGPHAAFQQLQDNGSRIPAELSMIRIPCTGRISKSLLFRAFEMGADGVALLGCSPGSCRYGSGTDVAKRNIEDTRQILDLLGLGKERLQLRTFLPEESEALLSFLQEFKLQVEGLGKSPVKTNGSLRDLFVRQSNESGFTERPDHDFIEHPLKELLKKHDIYACQDCGKCSSSCPLSLTGKPFSPRSVANSAISGDIESESLIKDTWACLTCGTCFDRCPSAVTFPEFIRDIRELQHKRGVRGQEAHDGFFQSLMRTMTSPRLSIDHWGWLPGDVRIDQNSKLLFFGGCAPYFDAFFKNHLGIATSEILVESLRLLNFFDIYPSILKSERCCGHDLLWTGDRQNFLKLAQLNISSFNDMGIEEIVTSCPECYRTLRYDYPTLVGELPFRVIHLYELIGKEIEKGAVAFDKLDRNLTFQDPCRLNRLEESRDLPRKLISKLKAADFQEMRDYGRGAICCGNCAWTGCDSYTKALQVKRLQQAKDTGANLLITACPKCQIHLRCAMEDPFRGEALQLEMMDLTVLLSRTIHWE